MSGDFGAVARNILALLMEKPSARDEFRNLFYGMDDVISVFPGELADSARWVLAASERVTPLQLKNRCGLDLIEQVASLHAFDLSQSSLTLETFRQAYQRTKLREMGLSAADDQDPSDVIYKAQSKLSGLSSLQTEQDSPKGDFRLERAWERINESRSTGYRKLNIPSLDEKLPGLNFEDGDLMVVWGPEKSWKTRTVMNVVIRLLLAYEDVRGAWISTEPLVTPEKIMLRMHAMLAVRQAIEARYTFDISPVSFGNVSAASKQWVEAGRELGLELGQRIAIYGPRLKDGNVAHLSSAIAAIQREIVSERTNLIVIDNFQQFIVSKSSATDYELMIVVVRELTELIAQYGVVCIGISQISRLGQMRGGGGLTDRLNFAIRPKYDSTAPLDMSGSGKLKIECNYSRESPSPWEKEISVQPFSGWMME